MKDDMPVEWPSMRHKADIKAANQHNQAYVLSTTIAEMEDGERIVPSNRLCSIALMIQILLRDRIIDCGHEQVGRNRRQNHAADAEIHYITNISGEIRLQR
jgi:hypothetical protein